MSNFEQFGLSATLMEAIAKKGYEKPSPIQEAAIPLLLSNTIDLIGKAKTGTGKTAAFGLPILDILEEKSNKVQAVILAPTRELAMQVAEELNSLRGKKRLRIQTLYGGQSMYQQLKALEQGVDIVVGTPGRIKDHLNRKSLDLSALKFFVLDEADEMLNMGFIEEIEDILSLTNDDKRMLLFSATMPKKILKLVSKYMPTYELIEVASEDQTTELVEQNYYLINEKDRFEVLARVIDVAEDFYGIVFCNTRRDTDAIAAQLNERGFHAEALHGDIVQSQREQIMKKFKKRKSTILVATDVAARGIDVNNLTHVVNYFLPQDPESYVHRIGRTGRAGKQGNAISLIGKREKSNLLFIEKIAKTKIKRAFLPNIDQLINAKKNKIRHKIEGIIEHSGYLDYVEVANEILDENDAAIALASILKMSLHNELNAESYVEIDEPSEGKAGSSNKQRTRIFFAKGRIDGYNPKSFVNYLMDEAGVHNDEIDGVRVLDNFCFATLPNEAAEMLIAVERKKAGNRKPLVTIAKDRDDFQGKSNEKSQGRRSRNERGSRDDKRRDFRGDSKRDGKREVKRDFKGGDGKKDDRRNRFDSHKPGNRRRS